MSIRLRFVLAYLVLSIAPLGALTWHSYASGARTLDEATGREEDLLARDISRRQRFASATFDTAFDGEQDDETAASSVDVTESLARAFVTAPGRPGDLPFVIASDGEVHARTEEDRARVVDMGIIAQDDAWQPVTQLPDWIVVTATGPTGSGLRLGVARPLGPALTDVRTDTARGAGLGLLFIAAALLGMMPLSARFTRHSSRHAEAAGEMTRMQRELAHGQRVQRDLFPRAPLQHASIQIAATSTPAREVGGDLFDYMALPDGRIALVIGDVSGKGVGAGLFMAHLQASLRTRLSLGQDVASLVTELDAGGAPASTYATLVIAIYDPVTRLLQYVNAGHPPPCVRRAQGGVERLVSTGLPVGLLPGRPYETRELALGAGDVVLFYTDGCTDAEDHAGAPIGALALERMVADATSEDPTALLREVRSGIERVHQSRELVDDMTLMLARVA